MLEFCCCDLSDEGVGTLSESNSRSSISTTSSGLHWQDDVDGNEQLKVPVIPKHGLPSNKELKTVMQTHQKKAEV